MRVRKCRIADRTKSKQKQFNPSRRLFYLLMFDRFIGGDSRPVSIKFTDSNSQQQI